MSTTDPFDRAFREFTLDASDMSRAAINSMRAVLGVSGAVAVILGVVLLFWPAKTIAVFAIFLGIYFVVAGIMRLGVGIFSMNLRSNLRPFVVEVGLICGGASWISMMSPPGPSSRIAW